MCSFSSVGHPNVNSNYFCYTRFSQKASPELLWHPPPHFENHWSRPCHVTALQFYGEIYKAAQAHSCWLQPEQLAQQWQHRNLYLGRHFQLSNIALWGTQQTGLAFPLHCTNWPGLLPCRATGQRTGSTEMSSWSCMVARLHTLLYWMNINTMCT